MSRAASIDPPEVFFNKKWRKRNLVPSNGVWIGEEIGI